MSRVEDNHSVERNDDLQVLQRMLLFIASRMEELGLKKAARDCKKAHEKACVAIVSAGQK